MGHGGTGNDPGAGSWDNEYVPHRVEALVGKRVVQMVAGYELTAVLTRDGEVFTFGEGGQLGHGGQDDERVPRRVDALVGKRVVQVVGGYSHSAVLTRSCQ